MCLNVDTYAIYIYRKRERTDYTIYKQPGYGFESHWPLISDNGNTQTHTCTRARAIDPVGSAVWIEFLANISSPNQPQPRF